MTVAIITGASSGLGKKYVDTIIKEYPQIDEIWLIARRKERLQKIADENPNRSFVNIPLDLGKTDSYERFKRVLAERKPQISILINNAGVDFKGNVIDMTASKIQSMINLNVTGSTLVIKECLPYIKYGGCILQVASVSAFVANPHQNVYSATKAYTASFAIGLREELKKRNINVCIAYPGNMDTEMNPRSHTSKNKSFTHNLPFLNIEKFAHKTIQAARHGRASYTMLPFYKTFRVIAKLIPHSFLVKFTRV